MLYGMQMRLFDSTASPETKQLRIAFCGKAGSGKDFAIQYLQTIMPTLRVSYADQLKRHFGRALLELCDPDAAKTMCGEQVIEWINARKHLPEIRSYLQECGEAAIKMTSETFWADLARDIVYGRALDNPHIHCIAISDCRKVAEANHARRDGFTIVRIVRTDGYQHPSITAKTGEHRSETEGAKILEDYVIENDGTPQFRHTINKLVAVLRGEEAPDGTVMAGRARRIHEG